MTGARQEAPELGRDSTSLFSVDPGDECLVFDARDVLMVIFLKANEVRENCPLMRSEIGCLPEQYIVWARILDFVKIFSFCNPPCPQPTHQRKPVRARAELAEQYQDLRDS